MLTKSDRSRHENYLVQKISLKILVGGSQSQFLDIKNQITPLSVERLLFSRFEESTTNLAWYSVLKGSKFPSKNHVFRKISFLKRMGQLVYRNFIA